MKKTWQTISSRTFLKTPWVEYKHDRFYLPSQKVGDYYYTSSKGSVLIIPVLESKKVVLVKQYRYLAKKPSIEFPMGGIKRGQTPLSAAKAELEEEAGYRAKKFKKLGWFNPFNGCTNEVCHVFLAKGLLKTKQRLDETEQIEAVEYPITEVAKLIKSNKIWDGQSIAAWVFAQKHI
ncbi:MAG: NUDIX hydrolase [Candidatus Kerfeldbacteria bacterium CG_4_10_14_0_8_um_filter_42_10]|uniref:NUDIX hydrolase n=1 Tax=Candidatus Kerfeldbacteria bacterium CG_4_10_14_0_8_um_filter_42_10 TaxID=2014248 RepID=A0A2M7RLA4_9BACT|nr:MAG: NUDIX hydrolase [Candidatus Kerfeldbacteria bacterium CG_4_10_14_0_8_um_filter_42_10]